MSQLLNERVVSSTTQDHFLHLFRLINNIFRKVQRFKINTLFFFLSINYYFIEIVVNLYIYISVSTFITKIKFLDIKKIPHDFGRHMPLKFEIS